MSACDACLHRAALLGQLAPSLTARRGELDTARRTAALLALPEADLIAAATGDRGTADRTRAALAQFDPDEARLTARGAGLDALCPHDARYPGRLGDLGDPPAAIFSTAPPERLAELTDGPAAAIVGSRRASATGLEAAYELGRGLGAAGVTVVSGLALGIDAAAHRGALDAGGRAVAVVAGGADVVYPRTNRALWRGLANAGAIVSELPPGIPPYRWGFPARNRIMAALASLVVIVEGRDPSGSLITAAFAAQLGRDVGAVPGSVGSAVGAGPNRLLRDGAAVIRGPQDALDELLGPGHGLDPEALALTAEDSAAVAALPPALRAVLEAVEQGLHSDAIAGAAGLEPGAVRAALGRLEAAGLIRQQGITGYVRKLARP